MLGLTARGVVKNHCLWTWVDGTHFNQMMSSRQLCTYLRDGLLVSHKAVWFLNLLSLWWWCYASQFL